MALIEPQGCGPHGVHTQSRHLARLLGYTPLVPAGPLSTAAAVGGG